jgi:hypothetical protein
MYRCIRYLGGPANLVTLMVLELDDTSPVVLYTGIVYRPPRIAPSVVLRGRSALEKGGTWPDSLIVVTMAACGVLEASHVSCCQVVTLQVVN